MYLKQSTSRKCRPGYLWFPRRRLTNGSLLRMQVHASSHTKGVETRGLMKDQSAHIDGLYINGGRINKDVHIVLLYTPLNNRSPPHTRVQDRYDR